MVVAWVAPQDQRLCDGFTRLLQQVRVQLLNQKFISQTLVDKDAFREQGWQTVLVPLANPLSGVVR